jgi:hypothetical protein
MSIGIGIHTNANTYLASNATLTTPTGSTSSSGSTFVAWLCGDGAFSGGTVTDSFGNTYVEKATDIPSSGGTQNFNSWVCENGTGGANHTFSITGPSAAVGECVMQFIEISGAAAVSLDQYANTAANVNANGSGVVTTPTITPTQTGELLLAIFGMGTNSATNFTAPTNGFTEGDNAFYGTLNIVAYSFLVDSADAAINTSLTLSGAGGFGYSAAIMSFIPASGGGGAALAATATETTTATGGLTTSAAGLSSPATESTTATGSLGLRHVVADLTLETTTTTGTSPFALGGAVTGFRSFASVMADQDTCLYLAQAVSAGVPNGPWEIGIGTYNISTNSLTRTQVLKSSNGNAAVVFAAGTTNVALTEPAEALWNKGVFNVGLSGGAITIDWSKGPYQMITLNAATPVITFANSMLCPHGVLEIYQDPTGGRVPTITGAVYRSGSAPTWATTAATHDTLHVHYNAVTGKSNVFAET